jgi:hypothetical protein
MNVPGYLPGGSSSSSTFGCGLSNAVRVKAGQVVSFRIVDFVRRRVIIKYSQFIDMYIIFFEKVP